MGGVIDIAIAVGLIAVVVYAWQGRNVARAGAIFVAFTIVACIASSMVFGRTAAYWSFVVLSISFVITEVVELVNVAKDEAGEHSWWVGQVFWNVKVQVKQFLIDCGY